MPAHRFGRFFLKRFRNLFLSTWGGLTVCLAGMTLFFDSQPLHAQGLLPAPASTPVLQGPPMPLPSNAVSDGMGGWFIPPSTAPAPTPVAQAPQMPPSRPILLPQIDPEIIWPILVDVIDDDFKIQREQRVTFAGGAATEGRVDTYPQTGATLLEPWRGDSVGFRERLESTLQSIRRTATVRLSPDSSGWRLEVTVLKDLENLSRPMKSTAGGASFRNDDSLYRYGSPLPTLGQQVGEQPRPVANPSFNAGWIPLGRDGLLEQRILMKTVQRLGVSPIPSAEPYYQAPETLPGPAGLPPVGVLPAPS